MYATATVTGQLGQDPKFFETQNGTKIMSFGIPVKNTNKETAWIQVKAFGKCVDFYEGKLSKGTSVSASGRLTPMFYTGKDGEKKSGWELNLHPYCLQFPFQQQHQQPQQQQYQQPQQQPKQQTEYSTPNLDEIPF